MKRTFNRKKRPSIRKKGLNKIKRIFKTIKKRRIEFKTPYNSSNFLIENNSSPFYDEDEDDIDTAFNPIPIFFRKEYNNLKSESILDIKNFNSCSTQSDFGLSVQV